LEHSRIYYFYNNGSEDIYCSSADIMQRNLDRRVETTFPIEDQNLKNYIKFSIIDTSLADNQKARIQLPTGKYVFNYPVYNERELNHQEWMMKKSSAGIKKIVPKEMPKKI
jgi:polyphosphate kinase